ncbi:MAG: LysR family transcriptional regulator [Thermoleophilaceae bacterium]|nr:LysR family transcriptional regulator [Thermoleophilaceae bacterium]
MLDVKRMRVLKEVAAQGSFSAAAEALSFTQSAVSQQVAALERETATTLVERGRGGVRLTDAGRALVSHADAVLARLADAEKELAAIKGLRGGTLRFGTFPSAGATLVPRAVAEFRERHPEVELTMVEAEPDDSTPMLRAGELDFALVFDWSDSAILDPELELLHLMDDPIDLVVATESPFARARRPRLAELAEQQWINSCRDSSCSLALLQSCRAAGFEPNVVFETDDHHASQAFVAAGVGVALLPRLCLTSVHPDVVVRQLGPDVPVRRVHAATFTSAYRSPATEAMLQILADVGEEFSGATGRAAAVA